MAYATLVRGITCFKKTCKTLGYMNNIVCKIIPGGGKAICIPWPILPVAYIMSL